MSLLKSVQNAELYAKKKHAGHFRQDGSTPYSKHLEDVVNRLKSLGVVKSELLCAGWLHDTLEDTETSFDDIYEKFDNTVAVVRSFCRIRMVAESRIKSEVFLYEVGHFGE